MTTLWVGVSKTRPQGLQTNSAPDSEDWNGLVRQIVAMQYELIDLKVQYALLQAAVQGQPIQTLVFEQVASAVIHHVGLPRKLPMRMGNAS